MKLNEYTNGWLVGDFFPALIKSKDIEVGIKYYSVGDKEPKHVHKISDEYTIIIFGKVFMNGVEYKGKDIVFVARETYSDFECLENCALLVLKTPSIPGDKYFLEKD